ncbi:phage minor head protein [Streptobacillus moniliformis]|uniref:phage minor head protein n=1 Tax=Streptobacillus moniliformis TaxID=34105 RepID=UPI0009BFFBF9|nr:phage minor head protein [Streptobacillus moniliformis]
MSDFNALGRYLARVELKKSKIKEFNEDDIFSFDIPFNKAIENLKKREPKLFEDLGYKEEQSSFWIKKTTDLEITKKIYEKLLRALENGETEQEFIKSISQFKLPKGYLKGVYRTVVTQAQQRGHLQEQMKAVDLGFEYGIFTSILDGRQTSICNSMHNKILKITDFVEKRLYPPLHYGCRSTIIQVSKEDLEEMKLKPDNAKDFVKKTVTLSNYDDVVKEYKDYYKKKEKDIKELEKAIKKKTKIDKKKQKMDNETNKINNIYISGVKKGKPMTHEEANNGNVNPNFLKHKQYRINCQSCVVTYEARLRGYDVETLGNTPNSMLSKLSMQTNIAWIDPNTGKHPEYIKLENKSGNIKNSYYQIKNTLKVGRKYTIQYFWKGFDGGHIQNIWLDEKDNVVVIYDPQTNKIYKGGNEISKILKHIRYKPKYYRSVGMYGDVPTIDILDITDLEFNLDVVNYIMKKKE